MSSATIATSPMIPTPTTREFRRTISSPSTLSTNGRTITHVRRTSAPRVSLAARAHIDMHDKGLRSISGAQEVISAIQVRKTVTKLILGHNALGDDGAQELFRFLCSKEGRRYRIGEISLNSNGIGNTGLEAIAKYLEGNENLKELFLQNNAFQGDRETAIKLSGAINSSRLELLSIASNQHLSDTFFVPFLSYLDSSSLRELQITAIGLTRRSSPTLSEFFASSRSHAIETLKCNANALGARAMRNLVAQLRTTNFTLQKLEVYANAAPRGSGEENGEEGAEEAQEESVEEARAKWTACEKDLKSMLVRNELLRSRVHEEALALLTYARSLLFCSTKRQAQPVKGETAHIPLPNSSSQQDPSDAQQCAPSSSQNLITNTFPFRSLPIELQQCILALLAPSLSASQRVRIFAFAADPSTLQPLLPSLRPSWLSGTGGMGCIPDPASLPFGSGTGVGGESVSSSGTNGGFPASLPGLGPGLGLGSPPQSQFKSQSAPSLKSDPGKRGFSALPSLSSLPTSTSSSPLLTPTSTSPALPPFLAPTASFGYSLCPGGKCMGAGGSVLCHRAEARMRWLAAVGCGRFEKDGRGVREVMSLLSNNNGGD
ncbi:RNI-like protein [Sanghuangporus baumii]|uniref:RNI-like protein n=1 Tax=Sanghuangporus baumii TaxID=108892 RepID=A0A9Q5MXN6_SANBA|nr:RNI-like protein [Sanghuangporus baumii]